MVTWAKIVQTDFAGAVVVHAWNDPAVSPGSKELIQIVAYHPTFGMVDAIAATSNALSAVQNITAEQIESFIGDAYSRLTNETTTTEDPENGN